VALLFDQDKDSSKANLSIKAEHIARCKMRCGTQSEDQFERVAVIVMTFNYLAQMITSSLSG